jgi:SAM-dependent methyltransferase
MNEIDLKQANQKTRKIWDKNAAYWDEYMGEGNDFVEVLCWPSIERMLDAPRGGRVLDIACGNGLTSRRLISQGYEVVAFDFSKVMIEKAIKRTHQPTDSLQYHVLDATDESALLELGEGDYDAAISNMALFDMAEIDPLFRALSSLLRPGGSFVFSVLHPCFNNPNSILLAEMEDRSGEIRTNYSVKVSEYLSPRVDHAVALRDQPEAQLIFHRPLQVLFNAGFEAGFVLDRLEERAFPADHPPGKSSLSWGANFNQIPPVLVARMRLPK